MNARWLPAAVIVVASSVVLLSASASQQTAAQLYQSGVYAEEVEGNLQKAIGIFEQVIRRFPGDRDAAANAQLHIGLCYERMGVEKAREAYEKVIKNYPGQAEAVARARAKLDSLLRAASLGKKGGSGPTLRQVPTPPGQDVLGRVSPDGKYLADVGGGTCNVWVVELATGTQRHLTPPDKNCSRGSPYGPRWSPDSTKLVFTWRDPAGIYDLRVVGLDGSAPRVLLPAGAAGWSEALDWSPDGKYILAGIVDRQEQTGLGLVSVADGSVRYLRTSLRYDPQDGRFSPDGLYIAYSRKIGIDGNSVRTRDVFVLSVDGSREVPIVQHPADDAFVDWLPDGSGILFGSDRDGTQDLWALAIENGHAQGVPSLVRRRVGPFTPLGLTRDGALHYRTPAPYMDVYTASLDAKTGSIAGRPKKEPLSWEGSNRWPVWSPDGKRLAYVSARPTVVGPFQPGRAREFILCVYSADTNLVREYRHEKVFTYPRWNADGRHLYVAASNVDRRGLFSLDLERGEYTPYYRAGENQAMLYFQFSGDGTWLVWVASRDNASIVMRRDNRTGEEKELDRVPGLSIAGLALSPDARHLAWIPIADKGTKVLKVMAFPDGTPQVIQQLTEIGRGRTEITFAPDGRFIYYSDLLSAGERDWHLWRIPTGGGTPWDMGLGVGNFEQLSVHPDGSRVTFAAPTINPDRSQVWVLENFLPARK